MAVLLTSLAGKANIISNIYHIKLLIVSLLLLSNLVYWISLFEEDTLSLTHRYWRSQTLRERSWHTDRQRETDRRTTGQEHTKDMLDTYPLITAYYHTQTETHKETKRDTETEGQDCQDRQEHTHPHTNTLRGTNIEEDPSTDDTVTLSQISDTKYLS